MEQTSIFDNYGIQYGQKITLIESSNIDGETVGFYRGYSRMNPGAHFIKMKDSKTISWFSIDQIKELHVLRTNIEDCTNQYVDVKKRFDNIQKECIACNCSCITATQNPQ